MVGGLAWWLISPLWNTIQLQEEIPTAVISTSSTPTNQPKIARRANLIAQAHEVAGETLIVETDSERLLRFENLKTINGPDLRIYLSADLNAKDFVDLGPIRATAGNVNYTIPTGTDLQKYHYVLIWCRAFSVLFSYAQL